MRNLLLICLLTLVLQVNKAQAIELNCQSFGPSGELEMVITSEQDIFAGASAATLTATGLFVNTFDLQLVPLEVTDEVALLALETTTRTGVALTGVLTIERVVPIRGTIELENTAGTFNPRIVERYELSDCRLL